MAAHEPTASLVARMLEILLNHYGEQQWWPADSAMEVLAGAILVQNTAWANAEVAVRNLKRAKLLTISGINEAPLTRLEELVRPAGFFRAKARTLKNFTAFVERSYGGSLRRALSAPTDQLREQLLTLTGIGPETADSILLYAGGHEVFVADAYARRILERHDIPFSDRAAMGELFHTALRLLPKLRWHRRTPRHPASRLSRRRFTPLAKMLNESHAVLVRVGVEHCRKRPNCDSCPLRPLLPAGGPDRKSAETEKPDANPV